MNAKSINAKSIETVKNFTESDYEVVSIFSRIDECTESVRSSNMLGTKKQVIPVQNTKSGKIYFSHGKEILPFNMATQNNDGTFTLYEITFEAYCKAGY